MHLTQQTSDAVSPGFHIGITGVSKTGEGSPVSFIRTAEVAVKSENDNRRKRKEYLVYMEILLSVTCQREYSESLFGIFVRKYSGKYQFHIFHDLEN